MSIIGGKITTYRNLAEQTVDRLGRVLGRKLPASRTRDIKLPGAYRLTDAANRLEQSASVSAQAADRLLAVYGGRAIELLELAEQDARLLEWLDDERTVLTAEVVFAIREEFARTLSDIVFRRLMIGLDADQGRPLYDAIAKIAARELDWSAAESEAQLQALVAYSDSFGV